MLDKQLEALMAQARAAGAPDLCELPPAACRGLYRQIMGAAGAAPDGVVARDLHMPGIVPGSTIGLRVYAPRAGTALPVVVWYHGGGYVLGDLDAYDVVCRQLCVDAQAVIVAVDYRLAPEHPYPAAFEDGEAALRWVGGDDGARALGVVADNSRLAVAGDSAGAVIAIASCMAARDAGGPRVLFQALAYPAAAGGHDGDYPSRQLHAEGPTLTLKTMEYFNHHCFGATGRAADARGAPLNAASLANLPSTLVHIAALDPLRDEAFALARRLSDDGTSVAAVEYHGLAHGYMGQGGVVQAARRALREFGRSLADAFAGAA